MKPILAIEQDPTLPGLGLLGRVVRDRGLPLVSAHAWEGDLEGLRAGDFAGIVPLGGSMQSWDEIAAALPGPRAGTLAPGGRRGRSRARHLPRRSGARARARRRGVSGRAAGGGLDPVEATPEAAGDRLLAHLREPVGVYQWHLDVFDLPEGSVRLARSALSENQAFRYGDRWWGLQFHPEVDAPLFAGWMQNYADAPARNGIDRDELEAAIAAGSPDFTEPLFGAFCAVCSDIAA